MPAAVILEFDGAAVGEKMYDAVNAELGLDPNTGAGAWPAGLISHTGGSTDDGSFIVFEIWESQAQQGEFMGGRLGAALKTVGVPEPTRVTWVSLAGRYTA